MYVYTLLSDPYNHMVWLDDKGIDYESVSPFDVFIMRWIEAKEEYVKNQFQYDKMGYSPAQIFQEALSFFLGARQYDISTVKSGVFCICDRDAPGWCFGEDLYDLIHNFIRLINCVTDAGKIKPGTKNAKRILIEDMRDEQRRARSKKKDNTEISLIAESVSAFVYGGNGGITPLSFTQLHIYQLLSGAMTVNNQMRVHAMLNGIYTGMLGTKNISESELRWTSV